MTTVDEFFTEHSDEYLKADKYAHLKGINQQMHIFHELHQYGMHDIVIATGHDTIYLGGDPNVFFERWGEEKTLDMIRCGLLHSEDHECFYMFV